MFTLLHTFVGLRFDMPPIKRILIDCDQKLILILILIICTFIRHWDRKEKINAKSERRQRQTDNILHKTT